MPPQKLVCPKCGSEDVKLDRPIYMLIIYIVIAIGGAFFLNEKFGVSVSDKALWIYWILVILHAWTSERSFICNKCKAKFRMED